MFSRNTLPIGAERWGINSIRKKYPETVGLPQIKNGHIYEKRVEGSEVNEGWGLGLGHVKYVRSWITFEYGIFEWSIDSLCRQWTSSILKTHAMNIYMESNDRFFWIRCCVETTQKVDGSSNQRSVVDGWLMLMIANKEGKGCSFVCPMRENREKLHSSNGT